MKALSKNQEAERSALVDKLTELKEDLVKKIEEANEAIRAANAARESYNEQVTEASNFASSIADEVEEFYDEKSDRWKEGEKGDAYSSWLSDLQQFSPTEIDEYEELAEPDEDVAEMLNDLPATVDNY